MDSNINQRLILVGVHLSQFCFHKLILEAGGEFKMFNSQVACAKKFQPKNEFFCTASKYGVALLICKKIRKNNR